MSNTKEIQGNKEILRLPQNTDKKPQCKLYDAFYIEVTYAKWQPSQISCVACEVPTVLTPGQRLGLLSFWKETYVHTSSILNAPTAHILDQKKVLTLLVGSEKSFICIKEEIRIPTVS